MELTGELIVKSKVTILSQPFAAVNIVVAVLVAVHAVEPAVLRFAEGQPGQPHHHGPNAVVFLGVSQEVAPLAQLWEIFHLNVLGVGFPYRQGWCRLHL